MNIYLEIINSYISQGLVKWKSSYPQYKTYVSIGSGKGLSPVQHQAITWANIDTVSIEPLGANWDMNKNTEVSFTKIHLEISAVICSHFDLGLDMLTLYVLNFSQGTETYIYILCHSSKLIWHRKLKSFLK